MKQMNEYTAEVLRRIDKKKAERKRARTRAFAIGAPLALAVCALVALPGILGRARGNTPIEDGPSANLTDAPKGSEDPNAITEPVNTDVNVLETPDPHGPLPIFSLGTVDLMAGVEAEPGEPVPAVDPQSLDRCADFALRLFNAAREDGKNELISPISLLCSLSMAANGAEGETLTQIEQTVGMTKDELNALWGACCAKLPSLESSKLELANSVWFRSGGGFSPNEGFLKLNKKYYGAGIFEAAFDDGTVDDINAWVDNRTDGMIPELLDEIPSSDVMYLINALSFDAEWETPYKGNKSIIDWYFYTEDHMQRDASFLAGEVDKYIYDDNAEGFIKYYEGRRYAFAALLPNPGISVADYAASLTGQKLMEILGRECSDEVYAELPMFSTEYSGDMIPVLSKLGISRAFEPSAAQFGGLGTCGDSNIFISAVLHKTCLSIDDMGTKASASAVHSPATYGGIPIVKHEVYLCTPFVYMLIDCETNLPLFIGALMDVEG